MPIHPFEATVSVVGTIVAAVMILTIFFLLVGRLNRRASRQSGQDTSVDIEDVVTKADRVVVHFNDGTTFDAGRIKTVTTSSIGGDEAPWKLYPFMVLEHEDGTKTLFRTKRIRMIEVAAPKS